MAATNGYDPNDLTSGLESQYVTPTADAPAFITAYGEANQTLTEMSPAGVKVQANTLDTWTRLLSTSSVHPFGDA